MLVTSLVTAFPVHLSCINLCKSLSLFKWFQFLLCHFSVWVLYSIHFISPYFKYHFTCFHPGTWNHRSIKFSVLNFRNSSFFLFIFFGTSSITNLSQFDDISMTVRLCLICLVSTENLLELCLSFFPACIKWSFFIMSLEYLLSVSVESIPFLSEIFFFFCLFLCFSLLFIYIWPFCGHGYLKLWSFSISMSDGDFCFRCSLSYRKCNHDTEWPSLSKID